MVTVRVKLSGLLILSLQLAAGADGTKLAQVAALTTDENELSPAAVPVAEDQVADAATPKVTADALASEIATTLDSLASTGAVQFAAEPEVAVADMELAEAELAADSIDDSSL
ncbi:MAG TPA: hypothetical protein VJJ83_03890 [Candidatus Babeliales bacterium]|nr:hypothetical protein [Candidatus Babeliales bacterium]